MQEQIKNQFEILGTFVSEYERKLREKINFENQVDVLKVEKLRQENKVKEVVFFEMDEESGKKKYTNEEMRSIATQRLLDNKEDYQKIKTAVDRIESELSKSKLEIEILLKRLSVLGKQADLLVALANYKAVVGKVKCEDMELNLGGVKDE